MYIFNRFGQYDLKLKINKNQNYVKNWEITKALTLTLAVLHIALPWNKIKMNVG